MAPLSFAVGVLLSLPPAPEISLSPDWTVERPPPYPNLVAVFRHRKDATLTLGVQFLGDGEDGESFARGNASALHRMGFTVAREGNSVNATARRGGMAVRQIYVVRGSVGWVVTLAGTPAQVRKLHKDLGSVAAQLAATRAMADPLRGLQNGSAVDVPGHSRRSETGTAGPRTDTIGSGRSYFNSFFCQRPGPRSRQPSARSVGAQ